MIGKKTHASRDTEILDALDQWPVRHVLYSSTQPTELGISEEFAPELMQQIRMRYSVGKVFGDPTFGLSFIVLKRNEGRSTSPDYDIIR